MATQAGSTPPTASAATPPALPSDLPPPPDASTALALADSRAAADSDGYESSSSDSDNEEFPSGPICPEMCLVGGPGFAGGSAQSSVAFRVTAKDDRGTTIREGGAYVTAKVVPGTTARAAGATDIVAEVKDNDNGTYTASYTVPVRGDYQVQPQQSLCPSCTRSSS